jgi:hypothetical protein
MNWLELLYEILEVCIIPLLGVLTVYAVKFIKTKSDEIATKSDNDLAKKYVSLLSNTISDCVIATNQTYVEALKKDNAFTKEAQEEAFKLTYNAVMNVLSDDAKIYLTNLYGDLTAYIQTKIEAEVNFAKQ